MNTLNFEERLDRQICILLEKIFNDFYVLSGTPKIEKDEDGKYMKMIIIAEFYKKSNNNE